MNARVADSALFEGEADSILRENLRFKGNLTSQDKVLISCSFEGDILDSNEICIAHGAKVKGDIHCRVISIFGEVIGNIYAKEEAFLLDGGVVRGDMIAPLTSKSSDSILQGRMDQSVPAEK